MIYRGRKDIVCPNPVCGEKGCWKHCNEFGCGEPIKWRPDELDRDIKYTGPKPLNMDGSVHSDEKPSHEFIKYVETGKSLLQHIQYGYPSLQGHYVAVTRLGKGPQQECDLEDCKCHIYTKTID